MEYLPQRRFDSKLLTGAAGVLLCFVYAMLYWPVWASVAKALISFTAAAGLLKVPFSGAASVHGFGRR